MALDIVKGALKNKIFWYIASRYGVFALQFLTTIFIAVKLDAYYFGIWSFIVLLTAIGGQFNWGIGTAVTVLCVQNKEDEQKCLDYIFNSLCLVLLTTLLPVGIAVYDRLIGIPLFDKYHLGNLVYAVAFLVILQYFATLFINIFRFRNKLIEVMIQQTLWPVVMFTLIFFATADALLLLLVCGYIFASMVALGVFFFRSRKELFQGSYSKEISCELMKKGFFLFLYNAGFMLITLSTKTMISNYYKVEEFGYFAFAYSLSNGVILLMESLLFLAMPKVIDLLKGKDRQACAEAITMLRKNYLVPLYLLFYIVLAGSSVFFYLLPQYSRSYLPFLLIMFTLVSYSTCFGFNGYLMAQNREKQLALLVLGGLVLNVIGVYLFIRVFCLPFEYAVLGTLIAYMIYSFAVNLCALKLLGDWSWRTILKENLPVVQTVLWLGTLAIVLLRLHPLWLLAPLVCYIVANRKVLKEVAVNAVKLIRNEKMLHV